MKLEVILNGVGSVTVEDEINHSVKTVKKLTTELLEQLKAADKSGAKRIGFESGPSGQFENNGHQHGDPVEMGVIVR